MKDFVLEEIRKSKKMTRKELAQRSGVNENTIKFLEKGINNPFQAKISTLILLATAMNCKVRDFYPCEKFI